MATRSFGGTTQVGRAGSGSGAGASAMKTRQLKQTQLNAQLARLSANLADTENLMTMTAAQAEAMRGLGSWHAGMFMAASKVLGEESAKGTEGA